jgi:hypothetical protein
MPGEGGSIINRGAASPQMPRGSSMPGGVAFLEGAVCYGEQHNRVLHTVASLLETTPHVGKK